MFEYFTSLREQRIWHQLCITQAQERRKEGRRKEAARALKGASLARYYIEDCKNGKR